MKDKIKIYLAGRMSGLSYTQMNSWRIDVSNKLHEVAELLDVNLNVINPVSYYNFETPRHQSEREIMQFDLNMVKKSDIVVVNLDGLNKSIGSCIELYEAYKSNIPVIALGEVYDYGVQHPWVRECITRVEKDIDSLTKYIRDFYFM